MLSRQKREDSFEGVWAPEEGEYWMVFKGRFKL